MEQEKTQYQLKIYWPAVLLWLFLIALAAAASWAGLYQDATERAFRREGTKAEARVLSFTKEGAGKSSRYVADYVFSATDPRTGKIVNYRGDGEMVGENYGRASTDKSIFIVYNAVVPLDNRPLDYDRSNSLVIAISCAAFGLFLLWYLCRDLRRYWGDSQYHNYSLIDKPSPFWYDPDAPPESERLPYGY